MIILDRAVNKALVKTFEHRCSSKNKQRAIHVFGRPPAPDFARFLSIHPQFQPHNNMM